MRATATAPSTSWADDPKQVAARMKAEAARTRPFDYNDHTDDGLARLRVGIKRDIEDYNRGWLKSSTQVNGRLPHALYAALAEVKRIQHGRFRLKMRYGAVDNHLGTHDFHRWYVHDDAPSYSLALRLDQYRSWHGFRHIFDWPPRPAERVAS